MIDLDKTKVKNENLSVIKKVPAREEPKTPFQAEMTDPNKSPLTRYMEIFLGTKSLWFLIKYELITLIANGLPGMLGFFLRKILYPRILKKVGKGVIFGRNITLRHPMKISIGDNVIIDDYCVLDAKGGDPRGIEIGNNVVIARNTVISCKGGYIKIGDNSNISLNSMIHSESRVELGKNVLIAAYCYIIGGGRHSFDDPHLPPIQQESISSGVVLGDNIWLGAKVTILDGVNIGNDAIIGAESLVNGDIPPFSIAVGTPAKVIRKRKSPNLDQGS